jgi:hypothetical protein
MWFKQFFRRIEYPKLGRWSLIRDVKIINRKVDLANEDHCGCCIKRNDTYPKNIKKTIKQ